VPLTSLEIATRILATQGFEGDVKLVKLAT
jgi:hypothetical protein